MKALLARGLRRSRLILGAVLATILISAAVAMALGQLLIPLLEDHPQQVAELLSWRLQQPVSVDSAHGEWQPSGPLLMVSGLSIGTGEDRLELPSAQLKVDFGAWLKPARHWLELRVSGVVATLKRQVDGDWRIVGLASGDKQLPSPASGNLALDIFLRDSTLIIDDAVTGRHLRLHVAALRAVRVDGMLRVGARVVRDGADQVVDVVAHIGPWPGDLRVYVAGENLDLHRWTAGLGFHDVAVDRGQGDVELWLKWNDGKFSGLDAALAVADVQLSSPQRGVISMLAWQGRIHAQREDGGWRLNYMREPTTGDDLGAAASIWWRTDGETGLQLAVKGHMLELARLAPWVTWLPQLPAACAQWLREASPAGRIDRVHLRWSGHDAFVVAAKLRNISLAATGLSPAIDALDASVRGDSQALVLELPAQAIKVDFPHVFRQPFALGFVQGTLAAWQTSAGWQISSDGLRVKGQGYAAELRGSVSFDGQGASPLLDLAVVVSHADVAAAKLFWPVNIMPTKVQAWLDQALVAGTLTNARALIRGHTTNWPFSNSHGRFEAVANVHDMTLDYHPDWPSATGLDAQIQFVNSSMVARAHAGSVRGNHVDKALVQIADFHQPKLELAVAGGGHADTLLDLLQRSPIGERFGDILDEFRLGGQADIEFQLVAPLNKGAGHDLAVSGQADLNNVDLSASTWSLVLDDLNGLVHFNDAGVRTDPLAASLHGTAATVEARIGNQTINPAHSVEVQLHGHFDAATLLAGYPSLQPLTNIGSGEADFAVGVAVGTNSDATAATSSLRIESDLRGMTLALPAPLDKPASTALPLSVQMPLPMPGEVINVSLGDVLDANIRLPNATQPMAADIALGTAAQPIEDEAGIRIHGEVERLDLSGWLGRSLATRSGSGNGVRAIDLKVGHLGVFGRSFDNLSLRMERQDGAYLLTIDGDQVAGKITVPMQNLGRRGITARLDRLYWPQKEVDADQLATTGIAPAAVPPLHLWVRDLRMGSAKLGDARFESYPIAGGMRVEQLETRSAAVQISARGQWVGDAQNNHSELAIELSSADLGRMLDAFGYAGLLAGGTTLAHIEGSWPGPPSAFSLADMAGTMSVHVEDGRILDIEPGVGRLFGLFSVRELPRRLSLDFGDLFQSGFSFNAIDGSFVFANGNARTDDLKIGGPSATIRIRGRTGLRAHDYDQYVDVVPRVGGALPVVGALAGGPVGAAAGLAMQALLGQGLSESAAASYHVTGPWANPVITRLVPGSPVPVAPPGSLNQPTPPVSTKPSAAADSSSTRWPSSGKSSL